MLDRRYLLNSVQMATFVARGFLRFDALIDEPINREFLRQVEQGRLQSNPPGTPLSNCFPYGGPVKKLVELPTVQGIIHSLVGPDPLFDHQAYHLRAADNERSQHLHSDATVDPRLRDFDVQLFYFPHEVTPLMGGTRFVPGSHMRVVSETAIARYQNVRGQIHVVCPAGTLIVAHHGLWHGAGYNRSGERRVMFKLRLNPRVKQTRLWNTDDLDERALARRPAHLPGDDDPDDLQNILCSSEAWFEADGRRLEWVNRILLWRALLGDETADAHHWLGRLENRPG